VGGAQDMRDGVAGLQQPVRLSTEHGACPPTPIRRLRRHVSQKGEGRPCADAARAIRQVRARELCERHGSLGKESDRRGGDARGGLRAMYRSEQNEDSGR